MNILPEKYRVSVVGERLSVERQDCGRRRTTRQLAISWRGKEYIVERDFDTDFSSYPRDAILWGVPLVMTLIFNNTDHLWYWLIPLLWPAWWRIDVTGVVHDKSWRDSSWGMSMFQGNFLFLCCALSGENWRLRANVLQGLAGYLILTIVASLKIAKRKYKERHDN